MTAPDDPRLDKLIADLSAAVAGQLAIIADRLLPIIGDAIYNVPDDAFDWEHRLDPITGELVVVLILGDYVYHVTNGDLITQTERAGRIEWTRVHDDGGLDPWQVAPPPLSTSADN